MTTSSLTSGVLSIWISSSMVDLVVEDCSCSKLMSWNMFLNRASELMVMGFS